MVKALINLLLSGQGGTSVVVFSVASFYVGSSDVFIVVCRLYECRLAVRALCKLCI